MADTTRRIIDLADNTPLDIGLRDLGAGVYADKVYLVNAEDVGGSGTYTTKTDDAGGGVTYVGKAAVGSADPADPVWQIQRVTNTAGDFTFEWADADTNFDNIWNDRASIVTWG